MSDYIEDRREQGFTLIELLVAIVVVGILAAVAIVGIAGLTNTGQKSACQQSEDSAKAASAAFYANQTPNAWPTSFDDMISQTATNTPPVLVVAQGVKPNGQELDGPGNTWKLVGQFQANAAPNFDSTTDPTLGCH